MCGGSAPAPDPWATAQAQNAVNKDALITAAGLNQVNQTGPFGSINYSGEIGSPDRTQTTTLSPELQRLLTGQTQSSNSLTDLANTRLAGAPTDSFQAPDDPMGYFTSDFIPDLNTATPTSTNFTRNVDAGPITRSFDPAGTVQRSVNTDFGGLMNDARNAQYAKNTQFLDPQFQQQEDQMRSRLAAQGITEGSDAYNQEFANFNRTKQAAYDDARNSAILQGDALQGQLFGQSLGAGQFSNDALAQQFGQNQNLAAFQNAAQGQAFGQGLDNANLQNQAENDTFNQNLAANQFGNDAMSRQFDMRMGAFQANQNEYQRQLDNAVRTRNQNINEAMSYLNGAPISPQQPTFQPIATSTAAQASPDMIGLAGSNYNTQQQARGGILGGIFGGLGQLGGAAITRYCWVAREVFGQTNPEWLAFREWLFTYAPKWLRTLYIKYGERFAEWIRNKPLTKAVIRGWMTSCINACP